MSDSKDDFLNDVFLTLKEYIQQSATSEAVVKFSRPEKLKQIIPALSPNGVGPEAIVSEIKSILDHSVSTIHPLF